jgi:hypothetical protein
LVGIVPEAKIGSHPQIEDDGCRRGGGLPPSRRRWLDEIASAIEETERPGGESIERNALQRSWPMTPIRRRQQTGRGKSIGLRQAQAEERREKKPAEPAKQEIFFQDRLILISA